MHFSLSPSSKSGRKRAGRDLDGRLASFPLRNGRSRRKSPPDATPEEASVPGDEGRHHPYVIECSHPLNRLVPRFATSDYISGERFVVGFCHNCRLHVTTPAPGEEDLAKYYPSSYYGSGRRFNHIVEWLLNHLYSYRALHIEHRHRPGKVLDIGCGRGLLLNKLRERGWEAQGTELSEEAAVYARDKLGLPVSTSALQASMRRWYFVCCRSIHDSPMACAT